MSATNNQFSSSHAPQQSQTALLLITTPWHWNGGVRSISDQDNLCCQRWCQYQRGSRPLDHSGAGSSLGAGLGPSIGTNHIETQTVQPITFKPGFVVFVYIYPNQHQARELHSYHMKPHPPQNILEYKLSNSRFEFWKNSRQQLKNVFSFLV